MITCLCQSAYTLNFQFISCLCIPDNNLQCWIVQKILNKYIWCTYLFCLRWQQYPLRIWMTSEQQASFFFLNSYKKIPLFGLFFSFSSSILFKFSFWGVWVNKKWLQNILLSSSLILFKPILNIVWSWTSQFEKLWYFQFPTPEETHEN